MKTMKLAIIFGMIICIGSALQFTPVDRAQQNYRKYPNGLV